MEISDRMEGGREEDRMEGGSCGKVTCLLFCFRFQSGCVFFPP
jgi:hypothetical protein